jgi:hypothetical protein
MIWLKIKGAIVIEIDYLDKVSELEQQNLEVMQWI